MPQSAQAAPPSALHAARCRHAVRQGLKLLAVVVLAVVVGVSVLDQRRVSQRNVRSHVFSSSHPPGHAARNILHDRMDFIGHGDTSLPLSQIRYDQFRDVLPCITSSHPLERI